MTQKSNTKAVYDLEERTFNFARDVRLFVKKLPNSTSNYEDIKQLLRASGSTGANYIEANESFSKKDFVFRIKICRKEAKESAFVLRLILETNTEELKDETLGLFNEAVELKKILSAIIEKSKIN